MSQMDDRDIVGRIRAGDKSGDRDLAAKYHRELIVIARATGLEQADADEAAIDVLYRAIERARRGKLGPIVGPFLRRSARNAALDRLRAEAARRKREGEALETLWKQAPYADPEPAKEAVVSGMRLVIHQALAALAKREAARRGAKQEVSDVEYLWWIGHGATNTELAEWSKTTEGNARVRRLRVVERMDEEIRRILGRLAAEERERLLESIRLDRETIEKLLKELMAEEKEE